MPIYTMRPLSRASSLRCIATDHPLCSVSPSFGLRQLCSNPLGKSVRKRCIATDSPLCVVSPSFGLRHLCSNPLGKSVRLRCIATDHPLCIVSPSFGLRHLCSNPLRKSVRKRGLEGVCDPLYAEPLLFMNANAAASARNYAAVGKQEALEGFSCRCHADSVRPIRHTGKQ